MLWPGQVGPSRQYGAAGEQSLGPNEDEDEAQAGPKPVDTKQLWYNNGEQRQLCVDIAGCSFVALFHSIRIRAKQQQWQQQQQHRRRQSVYIRKPSEQLATGNWRLSVFGQIRVCVLRLHGFTRRRKRSAGSAPSGRTRKCSSSAVAATAQQQRIVPFHLPPTASILLLTV